MTCCLLKDLAKLGGGWPKCLMEHWGRKAGELCAVAPEQEHGSTDAIETCNMQRNI